MAATKQQINWSAVGFTPTGGSLLSFNKIDSIDIGLGGTLEKYSGDTDIYNTSVFNTMNEPTISVESSNPAEFIGIAIGTVGTFTATHKDAKLATGGDIIYTAINAVVEDVSTSGAHAKIGTATLKLSLFSSDGTTSPLSFTRA